jgi:hypothetical protein
MKRLKRFRTDFLFATPTITIGVGSIMNIAGSYYSFNGSSTAAEADFKAIQADWGVVGEDIRNAMKSFDDTANVPCLK